MDLNIARREAIELFHAVNGLAKFSTQAGFYIGANVSVLNNQITEHDKFFKTLEQNFATKIGEPDKQTIVYEDDGRTPKVEGQNLRDFDIAYEKYLDEKVDIKDLRAFSKNDLKVRVTEKGKSDLVMPDLPGVLLGPCMKHGLITDLD